MFKIRIAEKIKKNGTGIINMHSSDIYILQLYYEYSSTSKPIRTAEKIWCIAMMLMMPVNRLLHVLPGKKGIYRVNLHVAAPTWSSQSRDHLPSSECVSFDRIFREAVSIDRKSNINDTTHEAEMIPVLMRRQT